MSTQRKFIILLIAILFIFSAGCTDKTETYGTLTVNSVPQNANISIDGIDRGKTPLKEYLLPYGKHEIVLTAEGYKSIEKEITINGKDKNVKVSFTLEKVSNLSKVMIKTSTTFMVVVDKHCLWKFTDKPIFLTKGAHEIQLINYFDTREPYSLIETFDVKNDTVLTENDFKRESPQFPEGQLFYPVQFDSPPLICCCSAAAYTYSEIYANETITIKGYADRKIKSFYIVFPSGKKVEVNTKIGNCDECANYFEKTITFDEPGRYKVKEKNGSEPILGESFEVDYKAKPVSPVTTVAQLFPFVVKNMKYANKAIVVFEDEPKKVKFLITDANGKIMRNTQIGAYELKTDTNGIVTFTLSGKFPGENPYGCCGELFVNGKNATVMIYSDLLANVVRRKSISKKYTKIIDGSLYLPKEMVAPSLYENEMPRIITVNGKIYVNIGQIIDHPEDYPDVTVKDNGSDIIIYSLIGMVP